MSLFPTFLKPRLKCTLKNHFKYGYTSEVERTFQVKLGNITKPLKSGLFHAVEAAQLISRSSKKITLCVSGGVDSHALLISFLKSNVPFNCVTMRFEKNLNWHDISSSISLCEQLGVPLRIIDLKVIPFFENGDHLYYGKKYRCLSPQLATHLWLIDQINGTPILSGNPIAPCWHENSRYFVGLPGDLHCSYFRYFDISGREGVPWFFLYTPELIASMIRTPGMVDFINSRHSPEDYTYLKKCEQYLQSGFEIKPRVDKFTGFEKVRDYYDKKLGTAYGVGFDQEFRRPLEKMNLLPKDYFQLVPKDYLVNI